MHISMNELEGTVCKAGSGIGLPLGLGEDAGRIARHLAVSGLDAAGAMADGLEGLESGKAHPFNPEKALGGTFLSAKPEGLLSALWVAPVLCDWILAQAVLDNQPSLTKLPNVDVPAVVLFACSEISARMETGIRVNWAAPGGDAGDALCHRGSLYCDRNQLTQLVQSAPLDLRISFSEQAGADRIEAIHADPAILRDGFEVKDATWRRLTALAQRCLVESNESSRLTGAGAGLVDTD